MSSPLQPTVPHNQSPLERCAPEILERIALLAVEEQLLGPPSDLLALLKTSRALNSALSPTNNNLYARVFALKFDTAAASRRLTPRWLTSKCLTTELRLRFEALKRIRDSVIDGPMFQRDLWTVFLILLEHDHKNALQLTGWARAHDIAFVVAERWLTGGYEPEFGEDVGGLVCTIIHELVREDELTEVLRRRLREMLYSHVICGYELSSFYASEEFFYVPEQPRELEARVRGTPPRSTQVQYYGHTITIAAPPLTSASLSVFMIAMQPNTLRYTPGYREEYLPGRTFSERMDDEWHRLVTCYSTTAAPSPLSGKRFTPSALIGSWTGTILIPNVVAFRDFLHSRQRQDLLKVSLNYFEAEMELREHHCLGEEIPLMVGLGPDGVGDDPLNAWIPRGTTFDERNDEFEVYDPIENQATMYDTYRIDAETPYASGYAVEDRWVSGDAAGEEDELEEPEAEIVNGEPEVPDEIQGSENDPSYIDEDGEDTVEHRDSGIRDIMITGTMKAGDYTHPLVGRIRPWDALIILLRLPSSPNDPPDVSWVFRGYIHGERHIVGRWKQTFIPVGAVGWECGFTFTKDL